MMDNRDHLSSTDIDEISALTEVGANLIDAILRGESQDYCERLLNSAPLWYQDEEEGITALHAAAYMENEGLVRLLIEKGALWNAVDHLKNTAGDIALSLNNEACYTIIRDAGIRAELLLNLLSSRSSSVPPSTLILREEDTTAAGSTEQFLSSRLCFTHDVHGQEICTVNSGDEEVGVMMGWEDDIMRETVQKLCSDHKSLDDGLKILNVGFGLGMIDKHFQSLATPPSLHVIIEPHPDVLQHMEDLGWRGKANVRIIESKWQDVFDSDELLNIGGFDVIYTDTFSEGYTDLHKFFKHLPDLLSGPESRFSFFNGLGATNVLFYDVYTHLAELHLAEVGVDVEWSDVDVARLNVDNRWARSREYFSLPFYLLPIGRMAVI